MKLFRRILILLTIQAFLFPLATMAGTATKPAATPFTSNRILKSGMKGEDVAWLQTRLIDLDLLNGKADGKFGSQTKFALIAFQRSKKLVADGIAGPATYKKLFPEEPTPTPTPITPKPTAPAATPAATNQVTTQCFVAGTGVRLRSAPSTSASIVVVLQKNAKVTLLSVTGEWSKVKIGSQLGYVHSSFLTTDAQTLSSPSIIVKKAQRKLELWDGETLYGSYPIGLGWVPVGPKQVEGDGRTPEGTYYVCMRNSQSSFYLSLGVSYPNQVDAKAALDEGTINRSTYDKIADAIEDKARPPWNTAMGGQIMIHGMGGDRDWTAGCIAVDNDVMDILWKYCPNQTPITILP